ncbi:MAG: tellurium resistance protein TerC [Armatimonadota bacterium]|nr:tellurium resistance protein TerC [Armatimonadota bacterium]MDR7485895.1 tellurium resistance protein TerC [Armatimonadota bacterium]MDR7533154.1 tellurium resistance protein TerC [Armatimonadota bacterium]MDR7536600.1 tellurium resistance protein TerC [Armatimonadota bacterium]
MPSVDWSALLIILQLVYLEGILSIDNAAVLGAMVSALPRDDPVPWPRPLRLLGPPVHRVLGGQQMAALKAGLLGAYLGRGTMLFAAAWVVRNRWLLLLGGLYLIYLAITHFGAEAEKAERVHGGEPYITASRAFWVVVLNVELADLAFSLDNVVAAVALSREMWVVLTGVFLGIVTMRFAAGIFVRLIQREPILEAAAYLLVLAIGFQVLAEDLLAVHISHPRKFLISLGIIAGSILYARTPALQALGARLRWLRRMLAVLSRTVRRGLQPLGGAVRGSLRVGTRVVNTTRTTVRNRRATLP